MPEFLKNRNDQTTLLNQIFNQLEMMNLNAAQEKKMVLSVYKSINKASH